MYDTAAPGVGSVLVTRRSEVGSVPSGRAWPPVPSRFSAPTTRGWSPGLAGRFAGSYVNEMSSLALVPIQTWNVCGVVVPQEHVPLGDDPGVDAVGQGCDPDPGRPRPVRSVQNGASTLFGRLVAGITGEQQSLSSAVPPPTTR